MAPIDDEHFHGADDGNTDETRKNLMGWGPFTLPASHPFTLGAQLLHDPVYQAYLDGVATYEDLIRADNAYLSYMKAVALEKNSPRLLMEAYTFYDIIVAFRELFRSYAPPPPSPL